MRKSCFSKLLGPLPTSRAAANGLVLRYGYLVAEWGDTERTDPTHSVTKSVLSTLLGTIRDHGLAHDIHDLVAKYVHDSGYDSSHNRLITRESHARQTSEWEGELWGKNADFIGHEAFSKSERKPRALQAPGSYLEYNDVRINRSALSLLRVWQKPLPAVFQQEVMGPIGVSNAWQWVPYLNAVVTVNGQLMPSVSGGTRRGGGRHISARDEARLDYLLRQSKWDASNSCRLNGCDRPLRAAPAGPVTATSKGSIPNKKPSPTPRPPATPPGARAPT